MTDLERYLKTQGYTNMRKAGGKLCGLLPMAFTTGLMVGMGENFYEYRYCYENRRDAVAALKAWDGTGHPGGPWIVQKGLRCGNVINPAWAAVESDE